MSVITAEAEPGAGRKAAGRAKARFWDREAPLAYLFMIPGLLILLLFMAYPFFLGIYLSLTDKMVGFADFSFIGLENYQTPARRPHFPPHGGQHAHLQRGHRAVQAGAGSGPGAGAESDLSLQPLRARRAAAAVDRADGHQQPGLADALRQRAQPDLLGAAGMGADPEQHQLPG